MPPMTLSDVAESELSFWSKNGNSTWNAVPNRSVWISTTGGNPQISDVFTRIYELTPAESGQTYQKITVDLSGYEGETVHIAFRYASANNGSTSWFIDDVAVSNADQPVLLMVTITPPENGTITVMNGNDVVADGAELEEGTVLTLTATADEGYRFVCWGDNITTPNREITLNSNVTISATFELIPTMYTVTITPPENGTFTVRRGSTTITSGTELVENTVLTLNATASSGYRFAEWMDGATATQRMLTLTQDTTIAATFKLIESSIAETLNAATLQVFPNPVENILNIQTEEIIKQIAILDMNGKIVFQFFGNNKTLDLSSLSVGNYVVRIHTENSITPVKIVKQ
jgi:hypothetical protein